MNSKCKNSKGPKIFRWLEFFEPFGNGYILIINYECPDSYRENYQMGSLLDNSSLIIAF